MSNCFTGYYRCPKQFARFAQEDIPPGASGYFRVGREAICYGSCSGQLPAQSATGELHDALQDVAIKGGTAYLPFDPSQLTENLRREAYADEWRDELSSALAKMYYFVRPALSVGVRRHLQKFHLRGWEKRPFPQWPVDCSVDSLFEQLMLLSLRAANVARIPFIWFWPDGNSSCAVMTHDIETREGRDACAALMDIDDSFGIKASFQVIPEERYSVSSEFLQSIRQRGFEVVVHDLNHDGNLYSNRAQFLERVAKINAYGEQYGAEGFRAGILYRKQAWYDELKFAYDMSVPNVAHLDPQHGGCCTVMPYFLGDILELPVTTVQDYTLFHILNDYSTSLWKQQINIIMAKHGLMSFVVHPDYVMKPRELEVYTALLDYLRQLGREKAVWIAIPGDVNRWWRQRAAMTLVESGNGWQIEGPGKERARVAYASEEDGRLVVAVQER